MICREWGKLRGERQWGGFNGAGGGKTSKMKAKSKTPGARPAPGAPAVGHSESSKIIEMKRETAAHLDC